MNGAGIGAVNTEMLRQTFLHIPGIGLVTERKLWAQGFLRWEDCLDRYEHCSLPLSVRTRLAYYVPESLEALLSGDARYFEMRLPPGEVWRLYREFREKTAFLDIETTGLSAGVDVITLIGLFDGRTTRVFIRGVNLHEFADEVRKYSLVVTFNGKRFDIPFIRKVFGALPQWQAHIDLMYPLRRLGYRGGLKAIEVQVGLEREGALKEMDGFLAVLLWREYQRGNQAALDTLVRYNLEDVVNLRYLADVVYNEALAKLPLSLAPLPVSPKHQVDTPFDDDLIHRLRRLTV